MRVYQLAGGSTGPEYRLLRFNWKENIFIKPKQPSFYLGYVLPSNNVLTSDGAPLVSLTCMKDFKINLSDCTEANLDMKQI